MHDVSIARIAEIAPYEGPGAIPGIRFRAAGHALGVSAWGMNVLELDPGSAAHPEHDHSADGHEELYVVMAGSLTLVADGVSHALAEGTMARVAGAVRRRLVAGDAGATVLAIGGTPGRPYSPSMGG